MTISENTNKKSLNNINIGKDVKIYDFVNAYNCTIDDYSKIGTFVEIQKDSKIGSRCKISSHTFICSGVSIGDNCFIGHGVVFINDNNPQSVNQKGIIEVEDDWSSRFVKTEVAENVSIGSNATILGAVRIGAGAQIGAGAVVTKDVDPGATVAGNPARVLNKKANRK